MRDVDVAAATGLRRTTDVHKLKKDKLVQALKKYGLNTEVTVSEGRKLLSQFIVNLTSHRDDHLFEMGETDSICFVCDKKISSENWKYKLLETASKKRNVPVADLIKQLVGNEFAVLIGEQDVVCSSCMNLLNLMDALTAQLKTVQTTLSKFVYSKYNLESESIKFQVQYDDSIPEETEPLHKCYICNFETKYEKEYNMHIRSHNIDKLSTNINSFNSKTPNSKSVKNKKLTKTQPYKKLPASKLQVDTKTRKNKNIVKQKKTKIVFQCSVCNKMFPNEITIRSHAKKVHGNENIIVSDESEYEDIQTLESSDEETSISNTKKIPSKQIRTSVEEKCFLNTKKKSSRQIKTSVKPTLDFLDDWDEDEDDDLKSAKSAKTQEHTSVEASLSKEEDDEEEEYDDDDDEEQDHSANPTCLFCNAKFLSFESVQDHVKMTHRDRASTLNIGLKTTTASPVGSFEIDSTTDIVESKNPAAIGKKSSNFKTKSYKCNICGIKKVSLKFIKNHIQAHKRKIALQCRLCGTSFRNIVALKVHRYRCHKVANVKKKCIQCKMVFVGNNQLKTHIRKVHVKQIMQKKESKSLNRELTSGYCLRKTVDSVKLPQSAQKSILRKKVLGTKSSPLDQDHFKISSCEVSSTSLENDVSSYARQKYICSLCNFISNSDLEMKGHMKRHDMDEDVNTGEILTVNIQKAKRNAQLKCDDCDTFLSKPSQLVNHMNRHKANTCLDLGVCFYCDRLFLEKEQVIIHMNTLHNFKTNPKCTVCGKSYSHGKDLKLHFLKMHFSAKTENLIKQVSEQSLSKAATTNSGCAEANDVYSKVFKELQDLTGEGNEVEDMSVDYGLLTTSLNYGCPLCDFDDCNKNVVKSHLSSHPQNYCNICKNIFNTEESIKHIENHSIEFQNKKCSDCEETFHDVIHLQCHNLRVHSGKKLYKCSMCEKSYLSEKSMSNHKQTMHGKQSKKAFSCNKCKMNFYSEKDFETHVEFAHRVGLNCKYCDKTLSDTKKLVLHEKNHLKQVKSIYKCNICGKVLKTPLALKSHKKIHNSNIPLQCEDCSESFKSFHALREHSAKHSDTQEKKFFCDVCGKGFYFYDSHYRHRRLHLDPLLFKCKTCGERFQTKLKLLEHKINCSTSTQCTK